MKSQGDGLDRPWSFAAIGRGVVIEDGVRVFHAETISLGDDVYVGHDSMLKGYYKNEMLIESGVWIGQQCFFHSAGGIRIGEGTGIGPGVRILTSNHAPIPAPQAIMDGELEFRPTSIGSGSDIGMSTTILPGVTIGAGVQIGAGAVVTRDIPDYAIAAGVPAVVIGSRQPNNR